MASFLFCWDASLRIREWLAKLVLFQRYYEDYKLIVLTFVGNSSLKLAERPVAGSGKLRIRSLDS